MENDHKIIRTFYDSEFTQDNTNQTIYINICRQIFYLQKFEKLFQSEVPMLTLTTTTKKYICAWQALANKYQHLVLDFPPFHFT